MQMYTSPDSKLWAGRSSKHYLYLHEKVICQDLDEHVPITQEKAFGILGYACDEGVARNQGRPGAAAAPNVIRQQLAKLPNHLIQECTVFDFGNIECNQGDMEAAQAHLATAVYNLLKQNIFPFLLGGGHDIAYGHYHGIKKYIGQNKTLGILNFDAHFDLRSNEGGNNSGTPFFQIAQECKVNNQQISYLCLGIREDANDGQLFKAAENLGVNHIKVEQFSMHHLNQLRREVTFFMDKVDHIYVTIDLDGFSSAYAPGVSAASPMGFSPDIVRELLNTIIESKKLISMDVAEMNPAYDIDNQTAKLAASLVHIAMHKVALL